MLPIRNTLDEYNKRRGMNMMQKICDDLELNDVLDCCLCDLPAGELQRFMIADVYLFDEPSSHLDMRQTFKAALVIRSLLTRDSYVIVVENDLSLIDYMSDTVCCLYGEPGAYGVFTPTYNVTAGINIYVDGFDAMENLRIRDESLRFQVPREIGRELEYFAYPNMSRTLGNFKLEVKEGSLTDSQIYVVLGKKGTGKTTFLRMLAGLLKVDGDKVEMPIVSYKRQRMGDWSKSEHTVRNLLERRVYPACNHPQFVSDVMKPLQIERLLDQKVSSLSAGEIQRVTITICLGEVSDCLFLIVEPSTHLDADERINAAKAIKAYVKRMGASAVIVERDLIMATYLADQVILVHGEPSTNCTAYPPFSLVGGMNILLRVSLLVTFTNQPSSTKRN